VSATAAPADQAVEARGGWRARLRRPSTAVAVGGVFMLLALLLPDPDEPGFLDPDSHARDGAAALVELASIHRQVDMDLEPQSDTSTALVLVDRLTRSQRQDLQKWVAAGGFLLVADPGSPLAAPPSGSLGRAAFGLPITVAAACEPTGARVVDTPASATAWAPFTRIGSIASCYPFEDGSGLVVHQVGAGQVLSFGAPSVLTNRSIGESGHATLASALVTWGPDGALAILESAPPTPGDASAIDLVPNRVWQALGLAALAMGLGMLAVGRRHGQPVAERVPVLVRGTDLTDSVAGLLARAGDRTHAANQLRAAARRALRRRLPGALDATPERRHVAALASQLALPEDIVARAIIDRPVTSDQDLVAVARATATLQRRLATPRDRPDS